VEKFDQLQGVFADLNDLANLRDRGEVLPHVVRAAAGWGHDVIEAFEVLHEQTLGASRLGVTAAIGHRLSAAGLIERIGDFETEPLQELQRGNADFRKQRIHITRYEQGDSHACTASCGWPASSTCQRPKGTRPPAKEPCRSDHTPAHRSQRR